MLEIPIGRRLFLQGAAGLGVLAALPAWAAGLPAVEEVANEPAIPALGNPLGNVTLVEFVDYQCPYCKICYREIAKLVAEDSDIRVVMKDWPIFGDVSLYAARAVMTSAGDRAYAAVVAGLMANDRYLSRRRVDRILAEAGIERAVLGERMASRQAEIDGLLERNNAQARAFGLTGTPGLLVGHVLYRHGLGIEKLRKAVAFVRSGEGTYPT